MFRKYQNGGEEINEKQYFANYLKEAEATDAYMKTYPSLVKKPGGGYYMALEDGIYYPYNDAKGKQTIGYGRHTNTILKDYPKGISVAKANEFLLEDIDKKHDIAKDQYDFGHVGSGINFEGFGEGEFDKLSEREQYMVTNFLYNPGHIYPKFSGALRNKDTKAAGEEYNIYLVTNRGKKNQKTQSLGRNKLFYDAYIKDYINNPSQKTEEELVNTPEDIDSETKISPKKETSWWRGEEGWVPDEIQDPLEKYGLWPFQSGEQKQKGGIYAKMRQYGGVSLAHSETNKEKYAKIIKDNNMIKDEKGYWRDKHGRTPNSIIHGIKHGQRSNKLPAPMQQYQTGGQQLPGGIMQQIPGSDAVEFRGQTHKQGGILMDSETEVENGETMDKVVMKDGRPKDYFFSSYLKKGGRSYADMHKEILAKGGSQKEINYLAAMQEKAAKRSPNKIAKLGGVMQYQEGGEILPGKKTQKLFQKSLYEEYKKDGGTLSFRKWNKENPFDLDTYEESISEIDPDYIAERENIPETTVGLRQDLPGAYGYRADFGDGYTICQSGNCQDGTGVMYTYYKENPDENDAGTEDGTVVGMYEGEFKDGKPVGQGKFTWNDIDASLEDGVPFVPWIYSDEGEFTIDNTGHPELASGTRDYGEDIGVSVGTFKDNKFVSGTKTVKGKLVNIEDGEETKNLSKDVRNDLVEKGLLEKIPFKYSQGDINPVYSEMKNYGDFTQPTEKELNDLGYTSFDEFRADYERLVDESYNWKNVTNWGEQHENALGELRDAVENKGFVTTGTFTPPIDNTIIEDKPKKSTKTFEEVMKEKKKEELDEEGDTKKRLFGFEDRTVPGLAIASGLAQTIPAIYAMTHKQPTPEQVPFESGVTSPIVPGRLRAKKLSHINMNKQRAANDAGLRKMNQYIDTAGLGPASMANRMAAWGQKHEGDMQIAAAEKQANIGIENQNVAIENQTNLHNVKMEQEAALGNAQMQMSEAQRLNEVNAINTAARNKIKDDEEYMKYAGVISAAQGVGSMFSDMLAYKGDMYRAQGYDIEGTTDRMLLRRHLGRTLYTPDGTMFCEDCSQEDIANYTKTYSRQKSRYY